MNLCKLIINKIKSKDKDLEEMYVAIDNIGNIIGFDKDLDKVRERIGKYNWEIDNRERPVYFLNNIPHRRRIKKIL